MPPPTKQLTLLQWLSKAVVKAQVGEDEAEGVAVGRKAEEASRARRRANFGRLAHVPGARTARISIVKSNLNVVRLDK